MTWALRSLGYNRGGGAPVPHFWLCDMVGLPGHIEPTGAFLDFRSNSPGPPCQVALCHRRVMYGKAKCPPVWVGSAGASRAAGGPQESGHGGEYERGKALHPDKWYPACP